MPASKAFLKIMEIAGSRQENLSDFCLKHFYHCPIALQREFDNIPLVAMDNAFNKFGILMDEWKE